MDSRFIYGIFLSSGLVIGLFLPYILYRKHIFQECSKLSENLPKMGDCVPSNRTEVLTMDQQLKRQIRVFCWVTTMPENHHTKAKAIMKSWGQKCSKILFVTTHADQGLPCLVLHNVEGREALREKTIAAFSHIHKFYLHEADWFLKADDDTFVIMENLRYFLVPYDQSRPLYFGLKMTFTTPNLTFMYGGAGYVLNQEAVRLLVDVGFRDETKCFSPDLTKNEDMFIGKCMEMLGIDIPDTYDDLGRERFLHNTPQYVIKWMDGPECCSDFAVSFHYIEPNLMKLLTYFLYEFRLLGVNYDIKIIDRHAYRLSYPYVDSVGQCEGRNSIGCKTRTANKE